MRRSSRLLIFTMVGLPGMGLILLLLSLTVPPEPPPEETIELLPFRSSYNPNPDGCKAFYLLLKRLGLEVEQWLKPPSELKEEKGLLVIIDPGVELIYGGIKISFSEITHEEAGQILGWVREGNGLLILDGAFNAILEELRMKVKSFPSQEKILSPIQPASFVRKVERIQIISGSRLTTERLNFPVYFKDRDGVVLFSLREGEGRIVVVSEPELSSNRGIGKEDNAALLTNIIREFANGGKVLIDEYHHTIAAAQCQEKQIDAKLLPGYLFRIKVGGGERKTIFEYLWEPPKRWVVLQLAVVVVLFLYSKGLRFGPLIPPKEEAKSSTLEHIQAISRIYRQAKAHHLALEEIYRYFKFSIGREFGLGGEVDISEIYNLIPKEKANRLRRLIKECEDYISKGIIEETLLLKLSRELETFKKEVRDHARIYL